MDPTPTDDERAAWARDQAHVRALMGAEDRRRLGWMEAKRAAILSELGRANEALRDLNRRTFRDAIRDLFGRHSVLETFRLNQHASYNDERYPLYVDALWLNEAFVQLPDLLDDSAPLEGWWLPGTPEDRLVFGDGREDTDRYAASLRGAASEPERQAQYEALAREAYGTLYEAARDAAATLRDLATRYGPHFFADAFGYGVTVEATRDAMRLIPEYVYDGTTYRPSSDRDTTLLRDSGVRLGSVTTGYATDPARAPHVALRMAREADLSAVESVLLRHMLMAQARSFVVPGLLYGFGFGVEYGGIKRLMAGSFEISAGWDGRPEPSALDVLAEALPATTSDGRPAPFDDVRAAVLGWGEAIREARARFGPLSFAKAFGDGRHTF